MASGSEIETLESVRYKVYIQKFPRLVEAVRPVVVEFAVNALSKSLISHHNKTQAENPYIHDYNRASILMSQILSKIKESNAYFDDFVAVLQQTNLSKLASELKKAVDPTESRTSVRDSDCGSATGIEVSGFKCPCGQCSFEKYLQNHSKCPGLKEESFPHLSVSHLNERERKKLTSQLIHDTKCIITEFQKFSDSVFKALKEGTTPIEDIISSVFSSGIQDLPRQIQDEHGDKLEAITTISGIKIFLIRHRYISFINYRILEKIIEEHCKKERQMALDSYLQKLQIFCKRSIFEVPTYAIRPQSSSSDHILVVKVIDELWFGGTQRDTPNCPFTLRDIDAIKNKVAEIIELGDGYIDLVDASSGCIQLTFSILLCREAPIFPLTTSQLSELIHHGIIVIYQPKPQLPTNGQDTGSQSHKETSPEDSKTPPIVCASSGSGIYSDPENSPELMTNLETNPRNDNPVPVQIPPIPPISIPGPPPDSSEALAGQPPYCISGPQEPYPPPPPLEEDLTIPDDYSLVLKPGQTVHNYQWELAEPGIRGENYIVVAPTGSRKTLVAALVISEHLKKTRSNADVQDGKSQSKVVFMVNTQQLAIQQKEKLAQFLPRMKVEMCVGDNLASISEILPHCDIVVCTAGKLLEDIHKGKVSLSDITLMVIDKCHHTKKKTPQAQVMLKYLETRKEEGEMARLPQVVGLTASPGAGDSSNIELSATLEHLITLCALLDASSGIKLVQEHRHELEQFTNKPSFALEILHRRNSKEEFISIVEEEMMLLEKQIELKFNCSFKRSSQEYETYVQQQKLLLEFSTDKRFCDQISILKVLQCCSQVLNVYMDLRNVDAISVLEGFTGLPDDQLATPVECDLKERITALITNLKMLPPVENPLLNKVEEKLVEIYSRKQDSQGIVFVCTKKQADSICNWIACLPTSRYLGLKPRVLTGRTREGSSGMTQAEQEEVIVSFREGECNILVATSVAEEGLDVPACNLVIRLQHVTNEIAKVQMEGRACAEESEGLTILSSDSNKTIQEIKNEERLAIVQEILESGWLHSGEFLSEKLVEKQHKLLRDVELTRKLKQYKQQLHSRENVHLICKVCKAHVCYGTDIFYSKTTTQYVVPREDFQEEKLVKKPHPKPKIILNDVSESVTKTHKIYCANCEADWGVMCIWQRPLKYEFPVLKCKSFIFVVNGNPISVAQWSRVPFEVYDLDVWTELVKGGFESDIE